MPTNPTTTIKGTPVVDAKVVDVDAKVVPLPVVPKRADGQPDYTTVPKPAPAELTKTPTLKELLQSMQFPVDELIKQLRELGKQNSDYEWLTNQAAILVSSAMGYEKLLVFKEIVAQELMTLVRTGKGPVTHDDVDLA